MYAGGFTAAPSQLPGYLKPALLAFKSAELRYLDSLPDDTKRKLARGKLEDFETEKNHIRLYGDVVFTLAGLKPCALFAHGTAGPAFAQGLAESCLMPLMREFELERQGFQLVKVEHKLLTSNPKHPGFQGAWVLANTRHPTYPLVKQTFLVPREGRVGELDIGYALGYPLPSDDATVFYIDLTEAQEAGVCCVPVVEYFCPSYAGYADVLLHYTEYRRVWEALGRTLTLDTQSHPRLGAMLQAQQAALRGGIDAGRRGTSRS